MVKFLKYLFLFAFPVLLLAIGAEVLLRKMPNDYSVKKTYLDKNTGNIKVLILGSSHAFAGLDPAFMLDSCYNAAYDSQTLNYDLEIFKKYKDQLNKLQCLVIPLSFFSLNMKLETGPETWRARFYNLYYGLNTSDKLKDHSEILGGNLGWSLNRLFNYYVFHKNSIHCSALGRGIEYSKDKALNLVETGPVSAKRHTRNDPQVYKEMCSCLDEIIAMAKEKNIRVILYTSPALPYYSAHLQSAQLNQLLEFGKSLDQKNENVVYYNFLTNHTLSPGDFFDADHLNETGAAKFSRLLDSCISIK